MSLLDDVHVRIIPVSEMAAFVARHHYSKVMPRITKVCYGGFCNDELVAAISFGWGSRPLHTIKRLFPSLVSEDYLEIGKMCLADSQPRNSESRFMSIVFRLLNRQFPSVKIIFTWADGMWGKSGIVYQSANFLYGGYIWTDVYQDSHGRRIHPLQLQSEMATFLRTQRPNRIELAERGWSHYFGKQFRYIRFLCDSKTQARLLAESPFTWSTRYPKASDLEWFQKINGKKTACAQPQFTSAYKRDRTKQAVRL